MHRGAELRIRSLAFETGLGRPDCVLAPQINSMTSQLLFKMEEMLETAKLDAFESAIQGIATEASGCSMRRSQLQQLPAGE